MSSYEEIINNTAERDGFRMSWNCWASNKLDMFSCVIPLGCMYTPLKELNLPLLQYEKISCCQINCKAVLNPFCIVDFRSKAWQCNLCSNRNDFPPHYSDISEQNLPSEMHESYSTIEYTTTNSPLCYPILYFLIDTCLVEEEMTSLKKSIVKIIQSLPDEWHVGLITFSRYVYVHDLSEMNFSKCYAFKPNKEYSSKKLSSLLEFGQHTKFNENNRHSQNSYIPYNRFVQPLGVCRDSFIQKINEIIIDEWPVKTGFRQLRSIGSALSIALSFLESTMPNTPVRVMLFNGGPCSYGNGNIVSELLKEPIRKHNDIVKDNAHYLHKALKYYDNLANKASNNGHTIDIYTASLDQTGLYEMRSLTSKTGGHMIMMHSFTSGEFEKNLEKVFSKNKDGEYSMCFSATLSIKTSRQIKVEGCIGHVSSANIKGANVSDTVEGIGGTNTWKINSLSTNSTFAFFFEVVANNTNQNVPEMQNNYGIVQFITNYLTCSGIRKTRVTTICRFVTDITSNMNHISASFDEETATCLIARKAALQCSTEDSSLVLRWIDRTLIRLCQKFADFQGNNTNSFTLPVQFSLYPQFMFHLRRSNFIQVFNYSPDETSYYRHMLFTESPKNMLIMIQPCLYSYSFNGPPQPVPLDAASIKTDTIILMDTFFQVVIYHGEVIDRWRKNGYQDRPEYSNVKFLLNAPQMDAQDLINGRFPLPHFVDTEADGSQARFLLCRVNPSKGKQGDGVNVLTDDVSFQVFMNHLRRLSVEA